MTRQKMKPVALPIALIDTRPEIEGEIIGELISTHDSMLAAFKGNDAFQARMQAGGEGYIRTKIVTLKERKEPLRPGEQIYPVHLAGNTDFEP